jgi:hypothetical protein
MTEMNKKERTMSMSNSIQGNQKLMGATWSRAGIPKKDDRAQSLADLGRRLRQLLRNLSKRLEGDQEYQKYLGM